MSTVNDFKAKLIGGGSRPNLFRVLITFPGVAGGGDTEQTSFMCKAASIPASVVEAIDVPYRGRILKVAGDRTFESWSITVFNNTDFAIRQSFERWMNALNAHEANMGTLNPSDYKADLSVEQLGRDEAILQTYNFSGAFPVNLGAIELAYDTNNAIEEFTVEFAYDYWVNAETTS